MCSVARDGDGSTFSFLETAVWNDADVAGVVGSRSLSAMDGAIPSGVAGASGWRGYVSHLQMDARFKNGQAGRICFKGTTKGFGGHRTLSWRDFVAAGEGLVLVGRPQQAACHY